MTISLTVSQAGAPITITTARQGPPGSRGLRGDPGHVGARGSLFLGSFATESALPLVDGSTVLPGDYAYVENTGELWVAS